MSKKPIRVSLDNVPAVGNYSHVTIIPRDAQLYAFSGQIGTDSQGALPESYEEQIKNTFNNLKAVLDSQGLNADDVTKVNIWATEEIDWDNVFDPLWIAFFGPNNPSMTIGYLSALGLPEIKGSYRKAVGRGLNKFINIYICVTI